MVARKENDRVFEPALRLKRRDDSRDLRVHALDTGIVVGERRRDLLPRPRPAHQFFIANLQFSVIKRMLGQKVFRRRRLAAGEPLAETRRRLPWIVRRGERHPREERLVAEAFYE